MRQDGKHCTVTCCSPASFPKSLSPSALIWTASITLLKGVCSALTFGNEDGGLFHHTALYFTLMSLHSKLSSRSRCKRLALGVLPNEQRPNKVLHTLLTWELHLGICLVSRAWVHMAGCVDLLGVHVQRPCWMTSLCWAASRVNGLEFLLNKSLVEDTLGMRAGQFCV